MEFTYAHATTRRLDGSGSVNMCLLRVGCIEYWVSRAQQQRLLNVYIVLSEWSLNHYLLSMHSLRYTSNSSEFKPTTSILLHQIATFGYKKMFTPNQAKRIVNM